MTQTRAWIAAGLVVSLVMAPTVGFAKSTKACGGECAPYFIASELAGAGQIGGFSLTGALLDQQISQSPSPSSSPSPAASSSGIPGIGTGSCGAFKFPISYAQTGPACEAIYLTEKAVKINERVVKVWAAAAATCGVACALYTCLMSPGGPLLCGTLAAAADVACLAAGGVAAARDIVGLQELTVETKQSLDKLSAMNSITTVAGGVTAGVVGGMALGGGGISPCWPFGIYSAITGMKNSNVQKEKKIISSNCNKIHQSMMTAMQATGVDPSLCASPSPSPSMSGTQAGLSLAGGRAATLGPRGSTSGTSGGGGGAGASPGPDEDMVSDDMIAQAAMAGGMDKFANYDGLKKVGAETQKLGINMDDLANRMAAGASVGEVLLAQGIQGLPDSAKPQFADVVKQIDDLANKGKFFSGNVQGTNYTGGGKGPAPINMKNLTFGMKIPDGPAGYAYVKEAIFQAAQLRSKLDQLDLGQDWLHPYWQGSIFDLISIRIDRTRERVDQLEWAIPANTFYAGSNLKTVIPKRDAQTNPAAPATTAPATTPPIKK